MKNNSLIIAEEQGAVSPPAGTVSAGSLPSVEPNTSSPRAMGLQRLAEGKGPSGTSPQLRPSGGNGTGAREGS